MTQGKTEFIQATQGRKYTHYGKQTKELQSWTTQILQQRQRDIRQSTAQRYICQTHVPTHLRDIST